MPTTANVSVFPGRPTALLIAGVGPMLVMLAGCTDYGTREFGVQRGRQEQTRVTSPPPLSMPPILTQDAAGGDQTADLRSSPPQSATGETPHQAAPVAPSQGEAALLDESGPSANANIRDKVDHDAQIGKADPALSNSLLFGADTSQQPIIQRGSKSWWDRIF